MPAQVIIDKDSATLWHYPETKTIHHQIKKFIHGDELRNLLMTGAETLAKTGATKWLSDDRNNGALSREDEQWCKEVWFPKALKAGWKHWAIVQPEKVVGQLNIKRFKETYAQAGINADIFSDLDQAKAWLTRQ